MIGPQRAKLVSVEQVSLMGAGMNVLVVLETDDGDRVAYFLEPGDAAMGGDKIAELGRSSSTGLHIVGSLG